MQKGIVHAFGMLVGLSYLMKSSPSPMLKAAGSVSCIPKIVLFQSISRFEKSPFVCMKTPRMNQIFDFTQNTLNSAGHCSLLSPLEQFNKDTSLSSHFMTIGSGLTLKFDIGHSLRTSRHCNAYDPLTLIASLSSCYQLHDYPVGPSLNPLFSPLFCKQFLGLTSFTGSHPSMQAMSNHRISHLSTDSSHFTSSFVNNISSLIGFLRSSISKVDIDSSRAPNRRWLAIAISLLSFPFCCHCVKIVSSDGALNDEFGVSVSVDGDYALVGAWQYYGDGYARVYIRSGSSWNQQDKIEGDGGSFGYSVSLSGNYALVGANADTISFNYQGSAFIFLRSGSVWNEQAKLVAADPATEDNFGNSVSLSGDYALIGAPADNVGGVTNQGSSYIFLRSSTLWSQQVKLTAIDGAVDDNFGYSVALSGDYALVGAHQHNYLGNEGDHGSAYVFLRSITSWPFQAQLFASDINSYDYFGISVCMHDDLAIIGASYAGEFGEGAAYVFKRSGTLWNEEALLAASGSKGLGWAVSIYGNFVVVGAAASSFENNTYIGAAYIFKQNGSLWNMTDMFVAQDGNNNDSFASAVSIDDDDIIIGSPESDPTYSNQGSAYLYRRYGDNWFFDCPPGTYSFSGSCTDCEAGKYNNLVGQSSCTNCVSGKYNPNTGSTSSSSCTSCLTGKYNPAAGSSDSSSCLECAVGKYNDMTGQSSCTDCSTAKYNPSTGSDSSSSCVNCAVGKYNPSVGQVDCLDCEVNTFQNIPGQSSCSDCFAGTCTRGETAQTSCDVCVNETNFQISTVSGCDNSVDLPKGTINCPTAGGVTISIRMLNSSSEMVYGVRVDGVNCNITMFDEDTIDCTLPAGVGTEVSVEVEDVVFNIARSSNLLSYSAPYQDSVHGCDDSEALPHPDGTSACSRDGLDEVTVSGNNFGPDQASVLIGGVKAVLIPLSSRGLSGMEQNTTIVRVPSGSGLGVGVNVLQKGGELSEGVRMLSYTSCSENNYDKQNASSGRYECTCPARFYIFEAFCYPCATGMICDDEGSVLSSISLESGYWRESSTDLSTRECPYESACTGSSDISNQCMDGHSGPLCAVCEDGYDSGSRFEKCEKCFEGSGSLSFYALLLVVCVVVLVFFGCLCHSCVNGENHVPLLLRQLINKPSFRIKLKVFLVYCQIVAQFQSILSVDYPTNYSNFLSVLQIFNLDLSSILSLKCFNQQYTFHDELMMSTLLPIFICLMLMLGHSKSLFFFSSLNVKQKSRIDLIEWLLFVLYFFFPSSSRSVFEMFNCDDDFESGSSYLRADYRLRCSGSTYESYRGYALLMILVYPIGIPLLFFSVLFPHRNTINMTSHDSSSSHNRGRLQENDRIQLVVNDCTVCETTVVKDKDNRGATMRWKKELTDRLKIENSRLHQGVEPFAFLFEAYKPEFWYWECVECMRRLSLTGLLVFMYPGTDKQILLAIIVCVLFMILYSFLAPFLDPVHNNVLLSAKWGIFLQLYGTLLLKQDPFSMATSIGNCMVAAGVLFPLIPVLFWRGWLDDLRNALSAGSVHGMLNYYLDGENLAHEKDDIKL